MSEGLEIFYSSISMPQPQKAREIAVHGNNCNAFFSKNEESPFRCQGSKLSLSSIRAFPAYGFVEFGYR